MTKITQHRDLAKKQDINFFYSGEIGYFLLSVFQLTIMAYFFGTKIELDYFLIAYLIPNFFIISYEGIIRGGVIPRFVELKNDYDESISWRYLWQIVLITILITVGVIVIFFILGRLILGIIALGLRQKDPQTVMKIFYYLMLGVVFANVSTIFKEVYLTHGEYRHPTIGKIIQTIILIISVIAYSDEFGIFSLVFGFTVGYVFEFIYLFMPLKEYLGYGKEFYEFYKSNAIKQTFKQTVPFLLTATFLYIEIIIDRFIAGFGRNIGTISALNYAFSLSFKIGTIFIIPTIWIFYPKLLEAVKQGKKDGILNIITKAVNVLIFFGVPAVLIVMFASNDFIRVLFFRGTFDEISFRLTRNALIGYSFNILLFGINSFLIMVFYAHKKLQPLIIEIASLIIVNFFLDIILFSIFGIFGIAFATSVVQFILMMKLFKVIGKEFGIYIRLKEISDIKKISLMTLIVMVVSILLLLLTKRAIGDSINDHAIRLLFIIFECSILYYILGKFLNLNAVNAFDSDFRPGIKNL